LNWLLVKGSIKLFYSSLVFCRMERRQSGWRTGQLTLCKTYRTWERRFTSLFFSLASKI
jgi:hypothetical protein